MEDSVKNKKGDAAFESVDEVLAGQVVENAQKSSEPKSETAEASGADTAAAPAEQPEIVLKVRPKRGIILAVCAAIAIVAVVFFCLRSKKRCWWK
jgi:hypothetical protein